MLQANAYAKINLSLHVVGKDQNGYHLLESLCAKLSIHDVITVEESDDLICSLYGSDIDGYNIALKAANVLRQYSRCKLGAHIHIHKNIPIAAGLGGGSANAAVTLKLLSRLWKLSINFSELTSLALEIGADVPFCMQSSSLAFVTGIGEKIHPIPTIGTELHTVLINNGQQILAGDIYKNLVLTSYTESLAPFSDVYNHIMTCQNDLEHTALTHYIQLIEVKKALEDQHGVKIVRMSGSGSTYFGIFDSSYNAQYACEKIKNILPKWRVWYETILI